MVGFAAVVAVAVAVCCTFLLRMNAEILINIAGIIFAKTTQTKIFQILVLINENMLNRQTCWQVVVAHYMRLVNVMFIQALLAEKVIKISYKVECKVFIGGLA